MADVSKDLIAQNNQKLNVIVKNPDGIVFNGEVFAITSNNTKGLFDVLPFHSNFVSIINTNLILYETPNNPREIKIESGVMKVTDNSVEIFLGVETITSI